MYLIHHDVVPLCPDHYRVVSYRKLRLLCSLAFVGLRSRKRYLIVSASLTQGEGKIDREYLITPSDAWDFICQRQISSDLVGFHYRR